jgi:hypothetical protein
MRSITTFVATSCIALGACCGSTDNGARAADTRAVARIEGPYVPAGTDVVIILQQELGTATTPIGTAFEARVKDQLTTRNGHILVPPGALVRGKVVDVDRGVQPSMKLDFRTIGTTEGEVPIAATVKRAQEYVWIDPKFVYDPFVGYEAILHHPVYHAGFVPPVPAPSGLKPQAVHSGEFALPVGTGLTLTLTRPLLGRSSVVSLAGWERN